MANPTPPSHIDPQRLPAKRAQGLDPEFTAQPRSVADEMAFQEPGTDEGLSVDPDDLGSRFLSQAVEQGYVGSETAAQADASLFEAPASDQALVGPNFEPERTVWEQTVDLSLQTRDPRDLRGPGFVAGDEFEEGGREAVEDMRTEPLDLNQAGLREVSLFDREGEGDETIAPDIQTDEGSSPPRAEAHERAARLESARGVRDVERRRAPMQPGTSGVARSLLLGAAQMLRNLAGRITPGNERTSAGQPRKAAPSRADDPSIPHLPIG